MHESLLFFFTFSFFTFLTRLLLPVICILHSIPSFSFIAFYTVFNEFFALHPIPSGTDITNSSLSSSFFLSSVLFRSSYLLSASFSILVFLSLLLQFLHLIKANAVLHRCFNRKLKILLSQIKNCLRS